MRLDLAHIAGSTFNTPLLMHKRRLDTALSALGPRILEGAGAGRTLDGEKFAKAMSGRSTSAGAGQPRRYSGGGYHAGEGVAVLPVVGTLLRRGTWLDAECGLMSYALIRQGFDEMLADPSVRGVLVEYDTPGGEAGGVFALAKHMRAAADAAGKPVWAHSNELAASAGYALACSADRVWVAETGEVGSIGVVAAHVDMSAADAKAGIAWTYIYEGDRKVDGNPHEPLSSEAEASIRADVRDLYDQFVELVAKHRNVSASSVRETEAETFRGKHAIGRKLADQVGTISDALNALAEEVSGSETGGPSAKRMARPIATPRSQATAAEAAVALARDQTRIGEITSVTALAHAAFDLQIDPAAAIERGVSVEAFRNEVLARLAERDEELGEIQTAARAPMGEKERRSADARDAWRRAMKRGSR